MHTSLSLKCRQLQPVFPARKAILPQNTYADSTDFFTRGEDVLFGRVQHPRNVRLRKIVNKHLYTYNQAKKVNKHQVSKSIVSTLRNVNPPSRFLRHNKGKGRWQDIGDKSAAKKVSKTFANSEPVNQINKRKY